MWLMGTRSTTRTVSWASSGLSPSTPVLALPLMVAVPGACNPAGSKAAQSQVTSRLFLAVPSPICPGTVAGAAAWTSASVAPLPTVADTGSVAVYFPTVTVTVASLKDWPYTSVPEPVTVTVPRFFHTA
jgi:hypothetical protein